MKSQMQISVQFNVDSYSGRKESSITLNNSDVKSLLKGEVPGHIVGMLQNMAKMKMQHDLQKVEEANSIQKENQAKINSGLRMFALYSDRKVKPKNPKSEIFLAKDLEHARTEYGYLTSWGVRSGVILEWDGAVPKYKMFVAGTVKRYPR